MWSSSHAILSQTDDHVVTVANALERVGDFTGFFGEEFDEARTEAEESLTGAVAIR